MKTLLAAILALTIANTASAQPGPPPPSDCCEPAPTAQPASAKPQAAPPPQLQAQPEPQNVAALSPDAQPVTTEATEPTADDGWHRPVGRRFLHGFRLGWTYIYNMEKPTREDGSSLAMKYGLKSPNMMLLGYEGFYRIVGHSWLNVLMVGNVTIAGLEQSKFIPAASGLIGFEFNRAFQLGVGVNLTPDPESPSHMIAAAGWTPSVGSIQTPVHFFFVPDTEGNHRMGATVGMTW